MELRDGLRSKHRSAGVARTARHPGRAIALAGGLTLDAVELRPRERHAVSLVSLTPWTAAAVFPVMEARWSGVLLGLEEEAVVGLATRAMRASAKRALESGRNPGEAVDAFAGRCSDRGEIAACEKRKQIGEIGCGSRIE
jgi:hypothetical protein